MFPNLWPNVMKIGTCLDSLGQRGVILSRICILSKELRNCTEKIFAKLPGGNDIALLEYNSYTNKY